MAQFPKGVFEQAMKKPVEELTTDEINCIVETYYEKTMWGTRAQMKELEPKLLEIHTHLKKKGLVTGGDDGE